MKKIRTLLSLCVLCIAFTATSASAASRTIQLSIENMTCTMCDITVRKAIEKVEGVNEVKVDYDTKTADVVFDTEVTTIKAIEDASTMAGYPAKFIIE